MNHKSFLFIVDTAPICAELLRVASLFKSAKYNLIFLFTEAFANQAEYKKKCEQEGFTALDFNLDVGKYSKRKKTVGLVFYAIYFLTIFDQRLQTITKNYFIIRILYSGFRLLFLIIFFPMYWFLRKLNFSYKWLMLINRKKFKRRARRLNSQKSFLIKLGIMIQIAPFFALYMLNLSIRFTFTLIKRIFLNPVIDYMWKKLYDNFLYFPISYYFWQNKYNELISQADLIINKEDVRIIFLAKDSMYNMNCCWVKAARDNNAITILLPFDMADSETLAKDRYNDREHQIKTWLDKEYMADKQKWIYSYKGLDLVIFSVPQILAAINCGLENFNPWGYNCSNADYILTDSEYSKESLVRAGNNRQSVLCTGHLYQDQLSTAFYKSNDRSRVADLIAQTTKKAENQMLICLSLPPNKLKERASVEVEFNTYKEMILYFVQTVTRYQSFNVIISLHPSIVREEVSFLENHGATIVPEDTALLIGLCDVYIVDCSATSKWALAAGKLVIDYDVMQYDLAFHSDLDGIIKVRNKQEFVTCIDRLASGHYEEQMNQNAKLAASGYWGKLDGLSSERIYNHTLKVIQ